jgi:hypothetical protein
MLGLAPFAAAAAAAVPAAVQVYSPHLAARAYLQTVLWEDQHARLQVLLLLLFQSLPVLYWLLAVDQNHHQEQ